MIARRGFLGGAAAGLLLPATVRAASGVVRIATPMAAPRWAVLQRELLAANAAACRAYYRKYVDARGYLKIFPRWGANDGPDDAAEATNDWELLHALGGADEVLTMARRFWEGHLRQYAAARTVDVAIARAGMYHREFPVQMDWQHNSEGLTGFNRMGLNTPHDAKLIERTCRFADFYTGADPTAANYDPRRRIVKSAMNGSRGPMLHPASALDWAGDPFDTSGFRMEHGEDNYAQTLGHYAEYMEVVGDTPLNTHCTMLGLNAYALGGGERYRRWVLDYLGGWIERARANDDILPSNVGLDGTIGGSAGGRWWGGVYGWGFSPLVPQTGVRENRNRVLRALPAFLNGTLLTGDGAYIDLWRRQRDRIEAAGRMIDGVWHTPTMYGANGWYGWKQGPHRTNGFEIWYVTQSAADRAEAGEHPWVDFLEGRNAGWAETALEGDLKRVRERLALVEGDTTVQQNRLADWTLDKNPASVTALIHQTTGGLHIARPPWSPTSPPQGGVPLHCRLRWFDMGKRRAGLPDGVAALVVAMDDTSTQVVVVNLSDGPRDLAMQGGAWAEHRLEQIAIDGRRIDVPARGLTIRVEPGCGARITVTMRRYAQMPTLAFPWDRT
ncbi:hypothetical protein [Sphingomonas sp. Leaf10]|uniref:hypothetical protein n=1 Tax=Sphingomonas sp. Leaf10 TaxID=1735676 RepID=UPI0006F8D8E3|nr:hypothetical protein [Sphingomonas sp. Leaf10]KQM34130.1 hypothetical protein ASE59_05595 [Sphingomonas sp. Leaf10]